MKRSQGFTLVELMVTIAVLAIIAMMAAPSFGNMLLKQNLNRSTQDLVSTLNAARSTAVLERREVTVDLSKTDQTADTAETRYWLPKGEAVLKSGSPTSITFQLSGAVKDHAANIDTKPFVICDGNSEPTKVKSKAINVSLMGTINIDEGTC
ncbi:MULTISPECIES: GspH/FimT family pseudopilin [Acinetobacter]|uniref:GspH/FimT family pseudopilin n=1 Tax=Acinetobacter TaxID=469 RepID=UPI0015B43A48|nr:MULTISPECIES: GspH/FimT family pseudopilin [Acinetobacter]MBT0888095.1 GspH/FimT family pseudopilin [Acinetobacter towneri]NWJ93502.1 GspH/FimT family pseudopilin [Acinetobacter sp. Swhac1]